MQQDQHTPIAREALSIDEVCSATNLGRTKIFAAISEGQLKAKKFGSRTVVLINDLRAFLAALPPAT